MSADLATLAPALGFTLGCIGIHALRRYAAPMFEVLRVVACALIVVLVVVGLSRTTRFELTDEMAFDLAGALASLPTGARE